MITCQAEDQGGWPCCSEPARWQTRDERRSHYCDYHREWNRFYSKEYMEPLPGAPPSPAEPHEITTDEITVWVNGATGLLGRFGCNGIDVHRPMTEQTEKGECLFCTHEPVTRLDWDVFTSKMYEHFKIVVPDDYIPKRLR